MSKFTFFTILFSLVVIVIVGQLVLRDAIFPQEYKSQVLTEEIASRNDAGDDTQYPEFTNEPAEEPADSKAAVPSAAESETKPQQAPNSALLTERVLNQAGFLTARSTNFTGKLFELFDFGTMPVNSITALQADENGGPIGVFTEIAMADEIKAQELYSLLQNKTKVYIDLKTNENNEFGDRSFYINHRKKPEEAFLVVRMRNYVYGFAYVKSYHPRVKVLISLLYTAILDRQTQ